MKRYSAYFATLLCASLIACGEKSEQVTNPWGDSSTDEDAGFSLPDIIDNGELIMLTVSGPETYYDYHGHGLGVQYLVCEKYARKIGVSLRVEVCADSLEAMKRLKDGEGDIAVFGDAERWYVAEMENDTVLNAVALGKGKSELAKDIARWYTPDMLAATRTEQNSLLKHGMVKRHVYPFMLNRENAVISKYDDLFRRYASVANVDWTLLAAQCYQESCFDPQAHSWAGACGLMQIMPSTADHLGLPRADIYKPEPNIHAAARLMSELQQTFSDISSRQERICFALAAYNGGAYHVRDAMALAEKYGKNKYRWNDVREYILALQSEKYYRDPVVKHGYMRGSETADYVDKIIDRWNQYRGATRGKYSSSVNATPAPAKRKNKWDKE